MMQKNCLIRESLFSKDISDKLYASFEDKNNDFKCADNADADDIISSDSHVVNPPHNYGSIMIHRNGENVKVFGHFFVFHPEPSDKRE